jgi:hypothetical protein
MNKEEFKKHVIAEAKKYLFSKESDVPAETLKLIKENVSIEATQVKPTINASDIKRLAEEMKKINKTIDLRNPLISESEQSLVGKILEEGDVHLTTRDSHIRERELDVDDINKKKHISIQNEGEKDRWNRVLNYHIPDDEERS